MPKSIIILMNALLALFFLTACQTLPLSGRLPDGLAAQKIRSVDKDSPFALSPDGNVIALASSGFKLVHIPSKEHVSLGGRSPLKLAWSPLGNFLAALFSNEDVSNIVVYDQHGIQIAESPVDARLTDLAWLSEDELLAGGVRVKSYKFGSNYNSLYFRWRPGRDMPVENGLRETTLKRSTAVQWQALLDRGPALDLSPQAGIILYLQPVDPPVFDPYYKLVMKDLAGGKELEIASVGLESAGGRFSADGEQILYGDGHGATLLYNPWSAELLRKEVTPGKNPAISPAGGSWFSDGALFRHGDAVIPLAQGAAAQFSIDGSRVVIRSGSDLYLLSGLKSGGGVMFTPAVAEKVAKLRSMRLQGLITPQEYKDNLLRVTTP